MYRAMVALLTARRELAFRAIETKTVVEWNADPRTRIRVSSWSDMGRAMWKRGLSENARITWAQFRECRNDGVRITTTVPWDQLGPND